MNCKVPKTCAKQKRLQRVKKKEEAKNSEEAKEKYKFQKNENQRTECARKKRNVYQ